MSPVAPSPASTSAPAASATSPAAFAPSATIPAPVASATIPAASAPSATAPAPRPHPLPGLPDLQAQGSLLLRLGLLAGALLLWVLPALASSL